MSNIIEVNSSDCIQIKDNATLLLKSDAININYMLENGDYKILIFNDCDCKTCITENGFIKNCSVTINYIDLNSFSYNQHTNINVDDNSSLIINSVYLGSDSKLIKFNINNLKSNTYSLVNNNVVCLDESDFTLECIGNITKGAKRSKCHQKSHCLTIGNPKKAKILPVLNIDENDVEASHSLSSGTIDQEIMFYMKSRGLSQSEALNLIIKSYLLPNEDFYYGFIDGNFISELAVKKVDKLCLI